MIPITLDMNTNAELGSRVSDSLHFVRLGVRSHLRSASQPSYLTMLLYLAETLQPAKTTVSPMLTKLAIATDYIYPP